MLSDFDSVSNGATMNVKGTSGTLVLSAILQIFRNVDVKGKNFLDLGTGCGRMIYMAVLHGASQAGGFELIDNIDLFHVFEAVLQRNLDTDRMALNICFKDIVHVTQSEIVGANIIFSFWFGIPADVRGRIISLASTSNATEFICTTACGETLFRCTL